MTKLSNKARASLQTLVDKLQEGDLAPIVQVSKLRLPDDHPVRGYSFRNKILAHGQGGTVDVRGFKAWQQVGRKVKKGGRAIYIWAPRTVRKKVNVGKDDEKEEHHLYYTLVPVFPLHQTEATDEAGEVYITAYQPQEPPPLASLAQRLGVDVTYAVTGPTSLGQASRDQIVLGTRDTSVWFHELAHVVDTKLNGPKKTLGQDPIREATAELTAATLMSVYDLGDHSGNLQRYLAHYHEDPVEAALKVAGIVGSILDFIFQEVTA